MAPRKSRSFRTGPALVATAVAIPITVGLAFAFHSGPAVVVIQPSEPSATGPVISAPTVTLDAAATTQCAELLAAMPVTLSGSPPRNTTSDRALAWGTPAADPILLTCGVARPDQLRPGATVEAQRINGVDWLQVGSTSLGVTYVNIDRAVYTEVDLPVDAQDAILDISRLIGDSEQRVCQTQGEVPGDVYPDEQLCTNRR